MATRIGDIYEAQHGGKYRYFQLVALDIHQLNADVIAVFNGVYSEPQIKISELDKTIDYFGHTTVSAGMPKNWHKVGKEDPVSAKDALFKDVDYEKEGDREPYEGMSNNWKIWDLDGKTNFIGLHRDVPDRAELGLVFNPTMAIHRMFYGRYDYENGYYGVNR